MGIGALTGLGAGSMIGNYRINSIYGNPKNLRPVGKIGQDDYSGNPFAIVSKDDQADAERVREKQGAPFDFVGAMERAKSGLNVDSSANQITDLQGEITRMMMGSRFLTDEIPMETV